MPFVSTDTGKQLNTDHVVQVGWTHGGKQIAYLADGKVEVLQDTFEDPPIGVVPNTGDYAIIGWSVDPASGDVYFWQEPIIAWRVFLSGLSCPCCLEFLPDNYAIRRPDGRVTLQFDAEFESVLAFEDDIKNRVIERRV